MDHAYFTDRISAFHDNELPAQERMIVEEHLAGCTECRAMLEQFRRLDALVAKNIELGGTDYWDGLARKTEERLGFTEDAKITDIRPKSGFGMGWKIATAAASFAALSFFAYHQMDIARQDEIVPLPGQSQTYEAPVQTAPIDTVHDESYGDSKGNEAELKVALKDEVAARQDQPQTVGKSQLRKAANRAAELPTQEGNEADIQSEPLEVLAPIVVPAQTDGAASGQAENYVEEKAAKQMKPAAAAKVLSKERPAESIASEAQDMLAQSYSDVTVSDSIAIFQAERDDLARRLTKHYLASSDKKLKAMAPQALTQTKPDTTDYDAVEGKYLDLCARLIDSTTDTLELNSMRELIQKIADRPGATHQARATDLLNRIAAR